MRVTRRSAVSASLDRSELVEVLVDRRPEFRRIASRDEMLLKKVWRAMDARTDETVAGGTSA